jgi:hypothetical protein
MTEYPNYEEMMKALEESAPEGWTISDEYHFIGVTHPSLTNEQAISFGDVNGCFGFNDTNADTVCGDMENIYEPALIAKSFWAQIKEFYPELFKPTPEELAYIEGAKDAILYLSDVFDGVEDTDIWADYFGEDAK